ncbi:MAG: hypothetical protein AB7D57_09700, partial [Desulfovibrionaceae bacterium]
MWWIVGGIAAALGCLVLLARLVRQAHVAYAAAQREETRAGAQAIYVGDPEVGLVLGPNVSTFMQRAHTAEHFFTNDLGERV